MVSRLDIPDGSEVITKVIELSRVIGWDRVACARVPIRVELE